MTRVEEEKDQSRRADKVIKHRAALCRLLARTGHFEASRACSLSEAKRTWRERRQRPDLMKITPSGDTDLIALFGDQPAEFSR
jgi:hypothetical protein